MKGKIQDWKRIISISAKEINCCSYRVTKLPEYGIKVIKRAPETINTNTDLQIGFYAE